MKEKRNIMLTQDAYIESLARNGQRRQKNNKWKCKPLI